MLYSVHAPLALPKGQSQGSFFLLGAALVRKLCLNQSRGEADRQDHNSLGKGSTHSLKMAKTSPVARYNRPPKFKSRVVRRCFRCGRKRAFMRDFGLCRACFREAANEGLIPGIRKSSW